VFLKPETRVEGGLGAHQKKRRGTRLPVPGLDTRAAGAGAAPELSVGAGASRRSACTACLEALVAAASLKLHLLRRGGLTQAAPACVEAASLKLHLPASRAAAPLPLPMWPAGMRPALALATGPASSMEATSVSPSSRAPQPGVCRQC
jgi:hypothetical protein